MYTMKPIHRSQELEHRALESYRVSIEDADEDIGAFLYCAPEKGAALAADYADTIEGPLSGVPFGVKDNIAVEGFPLTCGSRILEGFTSPYSATAVKRLMRAGAVPVGKLNLDEFGMGSSTEHSAYKVTTNPWDPERVPGGSSGGSAAAVAAGFVPFALGSDTGGSVRQPAAFCGTYGLKPTYGVVSRYGLVAYASSLECIGILGESIDMTRAVFQTISGSDPIDQTSVDAPQYRLSDGFNVGHGADGTNWSGTVKVAVPSGFGGLSPAIEAGMKRTVEAMRSMGWEIHEVDLPALDYAVPVYYTIATAEASSNLARYTGIRYGRRAATSAGPEEMTRLTREEGFGDEVKLRVLLGTYVLRSGFQDQYYVRAQKIRTLIRRQIDELFAEHALVLMPAFPTQAFRRGDADLTPFMQKLADQYTVTANLAGIPALSMPVGMEEGLPVGMQLMAPRFQEERLFAAAEAVTASLGCGGRITTARHRLYTVDGAQGGGDHGSL